MKQSLMLLLVLFMTTAVFAQAGPGKVKQIKTDTAGLVKYTCPMHPEVVLDKPGKCPKCGMTLVKTKAAPAKLYTCPMHPQVVAMKPGKCPKCGMNLVEKKAATEKKDASMDNMKMK